MDQKQLRVLVARMQDRVATAGDGELGKAWDALVSHLALGPEPEVRVCPHCSHEIMRAATMCGYCWTKSVDKGAAHA